MKLLSLILFSLLSFNAISDDVFIEGYTKPDGTYVQPQIISTPEPRTNYSDVPQEQEAERNTREDESYETINYRDWDVDDTDWPVTEEF